MTSSPARRPERRLRAVPATPNKPRSISTWLFQGSGLFLLSLIAYGMARPSAVDRCIQRRYEQVLSSHGLDPQQIQPDVRISETNKATNYCNGGTGQLHWQR